MSIKKYKTDSECRWCNKEKIVRVSVGFPTLHCVNCNRDRSTPPHKDGIELTDRIRG